MALKAGKCKNYGGCHYADDRIVQRVDDLDFVCRNPDCKEPLWPWDQKENDTPRFQPKRIVLVAALLILIAAGTAGYLWFRPSRNDGPPPPAYDGLATKPMASWMAEFAIER